MWFLYTILYSCCLAGVNYIDGHLTVKSTVSKKSNIHKQVGGILLISTITTLFGSLAVFLLLKDLTISSFAVYLSLGSAIPIVMLWIGYFYALLKYPAHQVVALFQLSTVFLLLIEMFFGSSITGVSLIGVGVLSIGAYLLDAGTVKWKIPTRLLGMMIPVAALWAISMYMIRLASVNTPGLLVSFYQMVGIGIIGLCLLIIVTPYRAGLQVRLKKERKRFLLLSFLNESFSQLGYVFAIFAIAAAPLAAYFSALGGLQSLILLLLVWIKPIDKKVQINRVQIGAMIFIATGVAIIELWKY